MRSACNHEGWIVLILLVQAGSLAAAQRPDNAESQARGRTRSAFADERFSRLRGKEVQNTDGSTLGRLADILIETETGSADYLLVRYGGWFGVAAKTKAAPAKMMSAATAKKGVLALKVGNKNWEKAPTLRVSPGGSVGAESLREADHYYGALTRPKAGAAPKPSPTGREAAQERKAAQGPLSRGSALLGAQLLNERGERLGKISDLLLDFSGEKPAVVMFRAESRQGPQGTFAILCSRLKASGSRRFTINAPQDAFSEAPPFTEQSWQNAPAAGPTVYRFN